MTEIPPQQSLFSNRPWAGSSVCLLELRGRVWQLVWGCAGCPRPSQCQVSVRRVEMTWAYWHILRLLWDTTSTITFPGYTWYHRVQWRVRTGETFYSRPECWLKSVSRRTNSHRTKTVWALQSWSWGVLGAYRGSSSGLGIAEEKHYFYIKTLQLKSECLFHPWHRHNIFHVKNSSVPISVSEESAEHVHKTVFASSQVSISNKTKYFVLWQYD